MAYVLAVGAALSNALTTILQRLGVKDAPTTDSMHLRLLKFAVRRRVWLAGFAVMVGGFVFQAAALHYGTLTSVQPVLTLELPFLVAILAVWFRAPVTWREWLGAVLGAGGLAVFLTAASPQPGSRVPDLEVWGMVSFSVLAACAVAVAAAQVGPPTWRAAMFGAAAAIMFAFTAALIRQVMLDASHQLVGVVLHWQLYAMAAAGLLGMFLAQNAFHAGPVTASQPSLVILDPLVSIGIGIGLFGDQLRTGDARVAVECVALTVLCVGGVMLARSPVVADLRQQAEQAAQVDEVDGTATEPSRRRQLPSASPPAVTEVPIASTPSDAPCSAG
jgi:drug/metabolite transporter (DMT)-like permease